jgi:hypothetical protein
VNLLSNITMRGIKADGMSCHREGGVYCILAQCPVTKILLQGLDVKNSIRVDNMYGMWFRTVSSTGIF